MIKCAIKGYTPACAPIVGGVANLYVADANDFIFTEGAQVSGEDVGYDTIEYNTGATAIGGAYLYEITSVVDTISVDISQSNAEGTSSEYAYEIKARAARLSQGMTNWTKKMDAASVCCQLLFVWLSNDGKIFVAGEKFVGDGRIPRFAFKQDGSKFSTGAKFSAFNGGDLSFKASYSRLPYEYTGGITALSAFIAP